MRREEKVKGVLADDLQLEREITSQAGALPRIDTHGHGVIEKIAAILDIRALIRLERLPEHGGEMIGPRKEAEAMRRKRDGLDISITSFEADGYLHGVSPFF